MKSMRTKKLYFSVWRALMRDRKIFFFFFNRNHLFYESGAKAFLVCPLGQLTLLNKYLIMHKASFSLMCYDKSEQNSQ